jgi:hypothetical protein
MAHQAQPPSVVERIQAAGVTALAAAGIAIAIILVLGTVMLGASLAINKGVPGLDLAPDGARIVRNPYTDGQSDWMGVLGLVVVFVLTWLSTCRAGLGTPGDAVMHVVAEDVRGGPAGRRRNLVRTGVPFALMGVATLLHRPFLGFVVVLALWAVALVRTDRRTAFDLVAGVVPRSTAPLKVAQGWPSRRSSTAP